MHCKVDGCEVLVTKLKPFCLEHWKADQRGELMPCTLCGGVLVHFATECQACIDRTNADREREATEDAAHFRGERLTATKLGEGLGLKAYGVNRALAELGWLDAHGDGWVATPLGIRQGAVVKRHRQSGSTFVLWPASIVDNRFFLQTVKRVTSGTDGPALLKNLRPGVLDDGRASSTMLPRDSNVRPGWTPGDYLAADGHCVRSRAEQAIDDWLYAHRLLHAYEQELPGENDFRSDFYLPEANLHIEFWGRTDEAYLDRKRRKQELYRRERIAVLELEPKHLRDLDKHLRRGLGAHGVGIGRELSGRGSRRPNTA